MNDKFYFCYDIDRAKYIKSNGVDYVTKAYHYRSNALFFLFERSPRLQQLIDEYDLKTIKNRLTKSS